MAEGVSFGRATPCEVARYLDLAADGAADKFRLQVGGVLGGPRPNPLRRLDGRTARGPQRILQLLQGRFFAACAERAKRRCTPPSLGPGGSYGDDFFVQARRTRTIKCK